MKPRWLALAASSSLAVYLGWPAGDTLRSTLVVLPWVLLLWRLCLIRLEADLKKPVGTHPALLWSLLALVAFAPWRHRLAWSAIDRIWMAAFLILCALALWQVLPALLRYLKVRPAPGPIFFVLPLAFYLAIQPWSLDHRQPDGDEPYYLLLSHSLAYDGDIDLANNYANRDWLRFMGRVIEAQPGDPEGANGEIFSRHSALLPIAMTPAYRLAGRTGATAMIAVLAAWVAWLTLSLARRLWPASASGALLAWLMLAFSPPLLLYSHQVWIEVPAALLTLLAVERLLKLHRASREGATRIMDLMILALILALLPVLKMRLLLVAAPLALLGLAVLSKRTALLFAGGLMAAVASLLAYNEWRYDNPFKMYSSAELDLLTSPMADWLRGAVGMFYDSSFGLFANAPIWWLLIPGLMELARRRDRLVLVLGILMTPYLAALAPRLEWYGGWSPPFRYPLVFLPLLALITVPLLDRRPAGTRTLATALAVATGVLSILWLTVPGWTYNLADGASHVLHQTSLQWQVDVARLFPSTVRPRPATWWWLAGSLALAPLAFVNGRGPRRWAKAWAFGLLLVATALLPLAATRLPTRVIEAEDVWTQKSGGLLYPDRWLPQRPSEIGGWRMTSKARLVAPVIVGGSRAKLRLHVRRDTFGPQKLDIRVGELFVGRIEMPKKSDWRWFELEVATWPAGEPLVIDSPQPAKRTELGLLLDRVEITWLD